MESRVVKGEQELVSKIEETQGHRDRHELQFIAGGGTELGVQHVHQFLLEVAARRSGLRFFSGVCGNRKKSGLGVSVVFYVTKIKRPQPRPHLIFSFAPSTVKISPKLTNLK